MKGNINKYQKAIKQKITYSGETEKLAVGRCFLGVMGLISVAWLVVVTSPFEKQLFGSIHLPGHNLWPGHKLCPKLCPGHNLGCVCV